MANTKPTPSQVGPQSIPGAHLAQVMPGFLPAVTTSITGDNTQPSRITSNK